MPPSSSSSSNASGNEHTHFKPIQHPDNVDLFPPPNSPSICPSPTNSTCSSSSSMTFTPISPASTTSSSSTSFLLLPTNLNRSTVIPPSSVLLLDRSLSAETARFDDVFQTEVLSYPSTATWSFTGRSFISSNRCPFSCRARDSRPARRWTPRRNRSIRPRMSPPSFHRLLNKNFLIVHSLSPSFCLYKVWSFLLFEMSIFLWFPLTQLLTILWRFHP